MRLLETPHSPSWNVELLCRQSRLMAIVSAVICSSLLAVPMSLIVVPAAAWLNGPLPNWGVVLIGLVALWFIRAIVRSALATFRRTNWCLAIEPEGLLVNLRSYRNYELPPARTVVELKYAEIASIGRHIAQRSAPSDEGVATWRETSLDLRLKGVDLALIRQAIAAERQRRTVRSYLWNLVTVSGRANHVPVTVTGDSTIRIAWRTRFDGVTPSLKTVFRHLAMRIDQLPGDTRETVANWQTADEQALDNRILQMIESGDTIGAIKVLVERRGYSWTDAKRFVDEIGNRLADPPLASAVND